MTADLDYTCYKSSNNDWSDGSAAIVVFKDQRSAATFMEEYQGHYFVDASDRVSIALVQVSPLQKIKLQPSTDNRVGTYKDGKNHLS